LKSSPISVTSEVAGAAAATPALRLPIVLLIGVSLSADTDLPSDATDK